MCIECVRKQRLRAGRRGMLLGGVALAGGAGMPGWASAQAAGAAADGKPSTDGAKASTGAAPGSTPGSAPGSAPSAASGSTPGTGSSAPTGAGSGQGFHSPQSAFPPLQDRPGVVSWRTLGSVSMRQEGKRSVPVFPSALASLAGKRVKVQGFMMPLQPGDRQSHFLLSAVPTTCSFCLPAGPEGIIEVRARGAGVRVAFDAMVMEGRLALLTDDPMGLLFRLGDAQPST